MPDTLNVIALISGGKDSLYSLLHCIQHGHNVVALANLCPPKPSSVRNEEQNASPSIEADAETADINSFMYQTVGHSIIPLYSEALGIPLYRREITGSAVVTDRYYSYAAIDDRSLDETEELIPLLHIILQSHPEANSISSGAIQSTYQRTRIESVALRLGLVPLAYLWQYTTLPPPYSRVDTITGLLDDMAAAGCDARIIKIASGGISDRLLWENVASTKTTQRLIKGLSPFFHHDEAGLRGAVVGEGGEYETLALSGPRSVWKNGFIVVDVDSDSVSLGEGGTSYVRFKAARVEKSREIGDHAKGSLQDLVRVPTLFDPFFYLIREKFLSSSSLHLPEASNRGIISPSKSALQLSEIMNIHRSYLVSENSIQITNINTTNIHPATDPAHISSPVDQMNAISQFLRSILNDLSATLSLNPPLTTSSIVHSILLLRSIDTFSDVNPVYASLFTPGIPNPPARVTIATPLPPGVEVSLSVLIDLGPCVERKGLHVQSRSYWAPANIGPYSQAICVPIRNTTGIEDDVETNHGGSAPIELCHVAGQIPLLPHSMEVFEAIFADQAILALQHLWRVGQEREVDCWAFGVAFLSQTMGSGTRQIDESTDMQSQSVLTAEIWKQAHHRSAQCADSSDDDGDESTEEDLDVWHLQYNRSLQNDVLQHTTKPRGAHLHQLPLKLSAATVIPAFIAVEMSALPRYAPVEWWSLGIIGMNSFTLKSGESLLDLKVKDTKSYIFSILNIASRVKLVAYMIKNHSAQWSKDKAEELQILTVGDVFKHATDDTVTNSFELASGTAFVVADAWYEWNTFCSKSGSPKSPRPSRSSSTLEADLPLLGQRVGHDSPLGEAVSIVPCHRIWGHGGQTTPSLITTSDEPKLEQFTTVFLLRFVAT